MVVLVDNHGYASIGALSRSVGSSGFGTHYRQPHNGRPVLTPTAARTDGRCRSTSPPTPRASACGCCAPRTIEDLRAALEEARAADGPVAVHIEVDRYEGVPAYEGWWDVPVAEVADDPAVQAARAEYEEARRAQRTYVEAP